MTLGISPHRQRRRNELFIVERTDRGRAGRAVTETERTHSRAIDWVEDMAEHVARITPAMEATR